LREKLVVLAPYLLGRAEVVYNMEFFHRIVGLCKKGPRPKEVTKTIVSTHLYKCNWPWGRVLISLGTYWIGVGTPKLRNYT